MSSNANPVYTLQRSPDMKGHSIYSIWIKEDAFQISSVELSQLLANVLQSQVKPQTPTNEEGN